MIFDGRPCLFCMNDSTSRLALDRRGRPFLHCCACGARAFLPSFTPCLNGVAVLTPYVRAIAQEMARDSQAYSRHEKTIVTFVNDLRTRMNTEARAPVALPTDVPAASRITRSA